MRNSYLAKVPVQHTPVNQLVRPFSEFVNGNVVEMPAKSLAHHVAAASWWSLRTHELDVDKSKLRLILKVVPIPVIHPLPKQLNRWLSTILFHLWHIEIIDKDNRLLAPLSGGLAAVARSPPPPPTRGLSRRPVSS